jgi:hypothetical protein
MADFTGLAHLRHAYGLGGACWAATMARTPILTMVAAGLYYKCFDGPAKLECIRLLAALGAVVAVWVVALLAFALTVNRALLRSFVSLETARDEARLGTKGRGNLRYAAPARGFGANCCSWSRIMTDIPAFPAAQGTSRLRDRVCRGRYPC